MTKVADVFFKIMNKNKSIAAYTTIWLSRNKQHWYEQDYFSGTKRIVVTKKDAPKIVLKRVRQINDNRIGLKAVNKEIKQLLKNEKTIKKAHKSPVNCK